MNGDPKHESDGIKTWKTTMRSQDFEAAHSAYASWGVDVAMALERMDAVSLSLHCWQGDDIGGFESSQSELDGGLAVTGNYPGKARTPSELRADLDQAFALIPGTHRLNLHAIYGEFDNQRVDRDAIEPRHFQGWMDWARDRGLGLDFNPTYFSHPKATDGFTLAHADRAIREFWIEHGRRCRAIGKAMGEATGSACLTNFWIPDGYKDTPTDRSAPRERLVEALDDIFGEPIDPRANVDSVESKLFGIGSESYVVGSHEFYMGYALSRGKTLLLDSGHYHPTESVGDKLSALFPFFPELALHISRGIRWDSDHVVTWTSELQAIADALVEKDYLDRTRIGLDFFDASINRVAAWVIGARNTQKALLFAMLRPSDRLREAELNGDYTTRLAWQEFLKEAPFGAIWNHFCERRETPSGIEWLSTIQRYESEVLRER